MNLLLLMLIFLEWFRYILVKLFFLKQPKFVNIETKKENLVAVLQPILSGDSELANNLLQNISISHIHNIEWIWLVDKTDFEGQKICERLIKAHPEKKIRIVLCQNAPKRSNPKIFKLDIGLKKTKAMYVAVLDDDTMITDEIILRSIYFLESKHADFVFGLPYYVSNSNLWSRLVSAFVNSNSLLSYIPYTFFFKPITINGMYYMTTSKILKDLNVFNKIKNLLCDDYAIAVFFNQNNLSLLQSNLLHPLNAKIESFTQFNKLIHRWFLFPLVSFVPSLKFREFLFFSILVVLPVFSILISIFILIFDPSVANSLAFVLLLLTKGIIFELINNEYFKKLNPIFPMFAMQFITPLYVIYAIFGPRVIDWRNKKIKVLSSNKIEIIN